ncbi:MAG: ferrous iron transport protein A [Cryobacterium sp.]
MSTDAARFVSGAILGTRIVVRRRIEGGFTDAIGYLRFVDSASCVVETRHGPVTIALAEIALAKAVPPPPVRRSRADPR